jgi:hypothetical protein
VAGSREDGSMKCWEFGGKPLGSQERFISMQLVS